MRARRKIDDDVLQAAKALASAEQKTIGEVISGLARNGSAPRPQLADESGFPVFSVSKDAPPITPDRVKQAEDVD